MATTGAEQANSHGNEYDLDPEPISVIVLVLVTAGAALFLVSGPARPVAGLLLASLAFGLLFPLLVYPWLNIRCALSYMGRIHFEWAHWALCANLFAAVAVHGTQMRPFTRRWWTLIPVLGIPALIWMFISLVGEGVE